MSEVSVSLTYNRPMAESCQEEISLLVLTTTMACTGPLYSGAKVAISPETADNVAVGLVSARHRTALTMPGSVEPKEGGRWRER
jgi:hypothetical protein